MHSPRIRNSDASGWSEIATEWKERNSNRNWTTESRRKTLGHYGSASPPIKCTRTKRAECARKTLLCFTCFSLFVDAETMLALIHLIGTLCLVRRLTILHNSVHFVYSQSPVPFRCLTFTIRCCISFEWHLEYFSSFMRLLLFDVKTNFVPCVCVIYARIVITFLLKWGAYACVHIFTSTLIHTVYMQCNHNDT